VRFMIALLPSASAVASTICARHTTLLGLLRSAVIAKRADATNQVAEVAANMPSARVRAHCKRK
jgi:hypothetical protein